MVTSCLIAPVIPAVELAVSIRTKQVSPVEVAGCCLPRIDELGPQFNALCYWAGDDVRAAASAAAQGWDGSSAPGMAIVVGLCPTGPLAWCRGTVLYPAGLFWSACAVSRLYRPRRVAGYGSFRQLPAVRRYAMYLRTCKGDFEEGHACSDRVT